MRFQRLSIRLSATLLVTSLLGSADGGTAAPSTAAQSSCDEHLVVRVDPRNELRYRNRGDRCEGLYVEELGGRELEVASFTNHVVPYDIDKDTTISVVWTVPPKGIVRVRGQRLITPPFYRLDAVGKENAGVFTWATRILRALDIEHSMLGVTASTQMQMGKAQHAVYLPVSFGPGPIDVAGSDNFELILISDYELKSAHVSVARVRDSGDIGAFLSEKELRTLPTVSGGALRISLAAPNEAGIYYVEVGAEIASGGSVARQLFFFQATARH
ncbi:MAG: hypothetical protein L0Z51_08265 [Candidatus Latescibacteria bacterium]|nr:hypothetical protein [Candidatus Latescibacterota bacterium]